MLNRRVAPWLASMRRHRSTDLGFGNKGLTPRGGVAWFRFGDSATPDLPVPTAAGHEKEGKGATNTSELTNSGFILVFTSSSARRAGRCARTNGMTTMTQENKLKRAARARAKRTGESYSTARRQVVAKLDRARAANTGRAATKARSAPSKGGVSEVRCIERTGHGFDHWFAVLDRFGAVKKGHTAAAKHLATHGVSAWYCQSITVMYERARGVRAVNQLCTGSYQVSVSRVLPVEVAHAARAISQKAKRSQWLADAGSVASEIETALAGKRLTQKPNGARIRFDATSGRVELRITPKDDGRCSVVADVAKLADDKAVDRARQAWREALDALRAWLKTTPS